MPTVHSTSTPPGRWLVRASSSRDAAHAQHVGFARLLTIERSLSAPSFSSSSSTEASTQPLGEVTDIEREAIELEKDKKIVDTELRLYVNEGVIKDPAVLEDFDLTFFWRVSHYLFSLFSILMCMIITF